MSSDIESLSVLLSCREVSCAVGLRAPSLHRIHLPSVRLSNRRCSPCPLHMRSGSPSHRQRQRRRTPSQHLRPAIGDCAAAPRWRLAKPSAIAPATRPAPTPMARSSCYQRTSSQGARAWPCGRGGSAGAGGRASAQTRAISECAAPTDTHTHTHTHTHDTHTIRLCLAAL